MQRHRSKEELLEAMNNAPAKLAILLEIIEPEVPKHLHEELIENVALILQRVDLIDDEVYDRGYAEGFMDGTEGGPTQ